MGADVTPTIQPLAALPLSVQRDIVLMSQQTAAAQAPGKTSILAKVAIVWAAIAAVVPTVIGVIMVRTPLLALLPGQ